MFSSQIEKLISEEEKKPRTPRNPLEISSYHLGRGNVPRVFGKPCCKPGFLPVPLWKVTMDTTELAQKPSVSGDYQWFSGCFKGFEVRGQNLETVAKVRLLPQALGLGVFQLGWALILSRAPKR